MINKFDIQKTMHDVVRVTVNTPTHPSVSLVAPLVATDFLAGIEELSGQWWCVPNTQINSIKSADPAPSDSETESLPRIRFREVTLIEFLLELPLPIRIQIEDSVRTITAVSNDWLIEQNGRAMFALPIESAGILRLLQAPDSALSELIA